MKIAGALSEARRCLAGHGASPELDAEVLLAHVLNGSRSTLIAHGQDLLASDKAQRFEQLLQRRKQGEPVAYLTAEKEFWSLRLKVTPDVLIPRPETELLVEWALEIFKGKKRPSILDLGAGSGAIALALSMERADAEIMATDASDLALAVAQENAARLNLANVQFVRSDWFDSLAHASRFPLFDLIVSNPPYISENDPHLTELRYEPMTALTSGPDGLSALRHITHGGGKFLKPGGWLLLEHGAEQGEAVRSLIRATELKNVATRRDLSGHERATGGQKA